MSQLKPETVEKVRAAYHAIADAILALLEDPACDRRHEGGAMTHEPDCVRAVLTIRPDLAADIAEALRHAIA